MFANSQKLNGEILPNMPVAMKKELHEILKIQSNSKNEKVMMLYLYKKVRKYNVKIDRVGNMIVTKGNADKFPCIVAHMDTVHQFYEDFHPTYYQIPQFDRLQVKGRAYNERVGIGGDDKCGLFSCLYMLEKLENVKVIFFTQEETGLVGSGDIDLDEFKDVGYIIQLDRWGRGDFICKDWKSYTVSDEYLKIAAPIMREYGYEAEEGFITDSINLFQRDVGISCVNVSCGYYQHHSNMEFIDLNEFYNSLLFTEKLMKALGENAYPKEHVPYKYAYDMDGYEYDDINGTWKLSKNYSLSTDKYLSQILLSLIDDYALDKKCISHEERGWLIDELKGYGYYITRQRLAEILDDVV